MRDDPYQTVRARLGSYRSRLACIPLVAAAVLLATGIVPTSAAAEVAATPAPALIVDQQQPGLELTAARLAITSAAHSEQKLAQTFTVGRSGQLRRIDLPVACASGKLRVEIQGVAGGQPSGLALSSRELGYQELTQLEDGEFVTIEVPPVDVAPGQKLALVLSNGEGSCGISQGPAGDSYQGGAAEYDAWPHAPGWQPLVRTAGSMTAGNDLPFRIMVTVSPPVSTADLDIARRVCPDPLDPLWQLTSPGV